MKIRVESISKSYNKEVLRNISLGLACSETVGIIGKSGVGKTTLLNIISGLEPPDCGNIFLDGRDVTYQCGKISYMMQKDLLLPHLRTLDNVSLPLVIGGEKKSIARRRALEYFDMFGLAGAENKYPHELSGGMRQRAALLRTYLASGDVVLLDEPFSALDEITREKMRSWYFDICKRIPLSTILITHDIDEAIVLSDRVYVLSGDPAQVTRELTIERNGMTYEEFCVSRQAIEYKKQAVEALSV